MSGAPSLEEALMLTSEPLAVFDAEANLRAANTAFAQAIRLSDSVLATGTPWSVVMSEAVRQRSLSEANALTLQMIEERLLDRPKGQPDVVTQLPDGRSAQAVLTPTSDGGFALAFKSVDGDATSDESELEEIMSKVLQACPSCLT
ncbi:MAG: PAS-domain containing protein, partial [Litoreibacter sp.]